MLETLLIIFAVLAILATLPLWLCLAGQLFIAALVIGAGWMLFNHTEFFFAMLFAIALPAAALWAVLWSIEKFGKRRRV